MLHIGKKLKTLRKESKLTAHEICEKLQKKNLQYTSAAIYKWEEDRAEPNIYVLVELCEILKASISSILSTDDLELHNLSKKEISLLEHFRNDETFMKIAMLMLRYVKAKV